MTFYRSNLQQFSNEPVDPWIVFLNEAKLETSIMRNQRACKQK